MLFYRMLAHSKPLKKRKLSFPIPPRIDEENEMKKNEPQNRPHFHRV